MTTLQDEQKAARRKERRRLRRSQQKVGIIESPPNASDIYPMLYDQNSPRTYTEGIQSTASVYLEELEGKSGEETKFLHISCYGRRINNPTPTLPLRDFSTDYYIPMDKFSQLGKNKKITSVDIFNRGKEKKGTLTATDKTFSMLVQRGELAIFGDMSKESLAECIKDKTFYCFATIIKTAQEPQHQHEWEIQKGIFKPKQTDPTSICTCKCGAKYVTLAQHPLLPTRGCTVRREE